MIFQYGLFDKDGPLGLPFSYNDEADAIFIELDTSLVYKVSVEINAKDFFVIIDIDKDNNPIMIEFLDWSKVIKKDIKDIKKDMKVNSVELKPIIGDVIVNMDLTVNGDRFNVKV